MSIDADVFTPKGPVDPKFDRPPSVSREEYERRKSTELEHEQWVKDNPEKLAQISIDTMRRSVIDAEATCSEYWEQLKPKYAKFERKYDNLWEKSRNAFDEYKWWRHDRVNNRISKLKSRYARLLNLLDELADCQSYCQDFIKQLDILLANEETNFTREKDRIERDVRRLKRDINRYEREVISLVGFPSD